MQNFSPSTFDLVPLVAPPWHEETNGFAARASRPAARPPSAECLRRCAWEIGEQRQAEAFVPATSHVALAAVSPYQGFVHWRILPEWVDETARRKGDAWHHCRLVVRLYDVSFIQFNGFNGHRIQDEGLPALGGQRFFKLPRPGTWQLAEVGFVLRDGEFLPAARSHSVRFAPDAVSPRGDHAALLVDDRLCVEEVGNLWEQEKVLEERRKPKLKQPLRIAAFAWAAAGPGEDGGPARFVTELAAGQGAAGHEVHVFLPASERFRAGREAAGVQYHPLDIAAGGSPVEQAVAFARAAERRLRDLPPFDLFHCHEWMTGLAPWLGSRPSVLSLGSIEATRRNGAPAGDLSREIEKAEREAAHAADYTLTPDWLREQAGLELGIDAGRVRAFPMEGRLPNEWERPLDYGQIKGEIGVGPFDRLLLFVGPLEHAAGVDLLLEALPVLLRRAGNLRLAYVGMGWLHGALEHRAHELGVAHAVRLLGHVEGPRLARLLRAAEALVLPSRYRVPFDDAVVDLARRAGRPVVTTHGGPAHLVRHEETGIVTYDNPGSMVWAVDRILGDPAHAERMGQNGRRAEGCQPVWGEVARHYLDLCAACFPELTVMAE
jgi:glycogen(starch) synthase